jgi:hypothetical protein
MEHWFQPVGSPDLPGFKAKQITYWDYISPASQINLAIPAE